MSRAYKPAEHSSTYTALTRLLRSDCSSAACIFGAASPEFNRLITNLWD